MKEAFQRKSGSLRMLFAFFALLVVFIPGAFVPGKQVYTLAGSPASAPCSDNQLSVRHLSEDAAMGGLRNMQYILTNTSSSACTLKGYPRVELLNKTGGLARGGRAKNGLTLMGEDYEKEPKLVTLEPGKTATFWIDYHARGAGYMGRPCPTYRKVRVTAPGTNRGFVLRVDIEVCYGLEVSPILSDLPREESRAFNPTPR